MTDTVSLVLRLQPWPSDRKEKKGTPCRHPFPVHLVTSVPQPFPYPQSPLNRMTGSLDLLSEDGKNTWSPSPYLPSSPFHDSISPLFMESVPVVSSLKLTSWIRSYVYTCTRTDWAPSPSPNSWTDFEESLLMSRGSEHILPVKGRYSGRSVLKYQRTLTRPL